MYNFYYVYIFVAVFAWLCGNRFSMERLFLIVIAVALMFEYTDTHVLPFRIHSRLGSFIFVKCIYGDSCLAYFSLLSCQNTSHSTSSRAQDNSEVHVL